MNEKVLSTYRGYGHKVNLIKRTAVCRNFAVLDNRRVLVSTKDEEVAKRVFMAHAAEILLQTALEL